MIRGILGGTFDPIHEGHLHIARFLLTHFPLDEIRMIPCYTPVHRDLPSASPGDRLAMVQLAIENKQHMVVDTREIDRANSSYMIDTLISLRQDFPDDTLCLILGRDAFLKFDTWDRWQEIIDYCHLIIVDRPNTSTNYSTALQQLITQHQCTDLKEIQSQQQGLLYFCHLPPLDVSSTEIRRQLGKSDEAIRGLPAAVEKYIRGHKIYVT